MNHTHASNDDAVSLLEMQALQAHPELGRFAGHERRRIIRKARYAILDQLDAGERDEQVILDETMSRLEADPKTASILTTILLTLAVELVKFLIRRLIERWTDGESMPAG